MDDTQPDDPSASTRSRSEAGGGPAGVDVVGILRVGRWATLAVTAPYALAWTQGLAPADRIAVLVAHAASLLAVGAWLDASSVERGEPLRLRLAGAATPRERSGDAPAVDTALRTAAVGSAVVALLAGAWLGRLDLVLTAAPPTALVAGWLAARLPTSRRWFLLPEVAPVTALVVPAALLDLLTPARVPLAATTAGALLLTALVLAAQLRDRSVDLELRTPTVATRDAPRCRGWLLGLAFVGALLGAAPVTMPLSLVEVLRLGALVVSGVAATVRRNRVLAMFAAQTVFAVTVLIGG